MGATGALAVGLTGCQSQASGGGDGPSLPKKVVVWGDPEDLSNQGRDIRDANNDGDSYVLIGTNGRVQFMPILRVCDDCDVEGATITLGSGQLIDIRFGVGPDGQGARRPFLVDRASGEFVELLGGGDSTVRFNRADALFEDPDDSSDDLAQAVGETATPVVADNVDRNSGLCGALGAWMIPMTLAGLLLMRLVRPRR